MNLCLRAYLALTAYVVSTQIAVSATFCVYNQPLHLTCRLNSVLDSFSVYLKQFSKAEVEYLTIECFDNESESSISERTFAEFNHLTTLEIIGCSIRDLSSAYFSLSNLRSLKINTHNSRVQLSVGAESLSGIRRLERLDLSKSNIMQLPGGFSCRLPYLKYLNLSWNALENMHNTGLIHHRTNQQLRPECRNLLLSTVDLSGNNLRILPPDTFSHIKTLSALYLSHNKLQFLDAMSLRGMKSLTELHLSDNMISSISGDAFNEAVSLRSLHLSGNFISKLDSSALKILDRLEILDLSRNRLTTSSLSILNISEILSLKNLNLSYNQVSTIDGSILSRSTQLEQLQLSHNTISQISDGALSELMSLISLDLSYNRLGNVSPGSLTGLVKLRRLDISHNFISNLSADVLSRKPELEELVLDGNKLQSLPKFPQTLYGLKILSANNNHIDKIGEETFSHLHSLFRLSLDDNLLSKLHERVFAPLKQLAILCLSRNLIDEIEPYTFSDSLNMEALRLDDNHIHSLGDSLIHLHQLRWLNLSDNYLIQLNYSQLPFSIEWLDVHNNNIDRIIYIQNAATRDVNIKTLNLSFNKMTKLSSKDLPNSIEQIFLNENKINSLESYTFFSLVNLSRVDLFANRLVSIDINALRLNSWNTSRVTPEFFIGGNPYICDCNMEWLHYHQEWSNSLNYPTIVDLESVYCQLKYSRELNYVPLVEADVSMFLCSYRTHCFATCYCCEFDACDCEMVCPDKCQCYHDTSWSRNIIDCSNSSLTAIPDSVPIDATDLYLDGNAITNISSYAFLGRKSIKSIYLNSSRVKYIANNAFSGLPELEVLHLGTNELESIGYSQLIGPAQLRELNLKGNRISGMNDDTFAHFSQLEKLTLSGNRISTFDVGVLADHVNLRSVELAENRWMCDCKFLLEIRKHVETNMNHISDIDNLTCFLPSGETLEINRANDELICDQRNYLSTQRHRRQKSSYFSASVAAYLLLGVVCFVTLVIVTLRGSRSWIVSTCGIRFCYHSARDEEETRAFDAFISYSEMDAPYIHHVFAAKLESGESSYRLALLHRDFPYCNNVCDVIRDSSNFSRRTIVVLSKHFIEHEWSQVHMKLAHVTLLKQRRNRLIVIFLGDISSRNLDAELQNHIRDECCIHTSDKQFWDKLCAALPSLEGHNDRYLLPYSHYSEICETK